MSDLPIGSIVAMLASETSYPEDWLLCDGSPCPEKYLDNLKEYLADKKTLPDLQGYTLIGAGKYTDGTKYTTEYKFRSRYGILNHTLTVEEMPSHQHFGYGENTSQGDFGFSLTKNANYLGGNQGTDKDNPLWGSTWAGGTNKTADGRDVSISTWNEGQATSAPTVNNPISVMQPSFAIRYFIYGGKPKT